MIYGMLADLVLVLHLAFILFVAVGGLLALRWPRSALVHLPAAAWGVLIELRGWICPLTPLENTLRRAAGQAGYEGGFIEHYLLPVVYPSGLTRNAQLLLAAIVVLLNAGIYGLVWRRRLRSD
jgi:hypothetical protein